MGISIANKASIGSKAGRTTARSAVLPIGGHSHFHHRFIETQGVGHGSDLGRIEQRGFLDRFAPNPAPVDQPSVFADQRAVFERGRALGCREPGNEHQERRHA